MTTTNQSAALHTPTLRRVLTQALHEQPVTLRDISMPLPDGTHRLCTPAAQRLATAALEALTTCDATAEYRETINWLVDLGVTRTAAVASLAWTLTAGQPATTEPDITRRQVALAIDADLMRVANGSLTRSQFVEAMDDLATELIADPSKCAHDEGETTIEPEGLTHD